MSETTQADTAQRRLVGMTVVLFLSYLSVAMSLPAISVHVTRSLGYGNALGGLAVGIAFLSTILTRNHAGNLSDRVGSKPCMLRGLTIYSLASLICLLSALPFLHPALSFAVLIVGRLLLGLGESLTLVGVISWGIGIMGPTRSGKVMALVGTGMYGAFAVGGPVGLLLLQHIGFAGLMLACALLPAAGWLMLRGVPGIAPQAGKRTSFWHIIGMIWRPGAAVGLQGVGFAGLGAFISLYFLSRGWPYAGLGLTCFGGGFVLIRLFAVTCPTVSAARPWPSFR